MPKQETRSARSFAALALLFIAVTLAPCAFGGTHVWSGGAIFGANWSSPGNWSSGGVPSPNEVAPVIIEFPAAFSGATTNNISGLRLDALRFLGSGVTLHGAVGTTLTFKGTTGTNLYSAGGNHIMADLPLVLEGNNRVVAPVLLSLYSVISGNGGLSIDGGVRFDGALANTYTGSTVLRSGALTLDKEFFFLGGSVGLVSVPGPLFIEAGLVLYTSDNGIADSALVTIETGGTLNLNGRDDTIGGLNLTSSDVQTGAGTLTLNGNVTATGLVNLAGRLSLGGSTRTFQVDEPGSTLAVPAVIASSGGIGQPGLIKTGDGMLQLRGANSYPGSTTISDGTVELYHSLALGDGAFGGTSVASNAVLALREGVFVNGQSLTLNSAKLRGNGTNAWIGPVTLNGPCLLQSVSPGHELAVVGSISGHGGFRHIGLGRVLLGGTNDNAYTARRNCRAARSIS